MEKSQFYVDEKHASWVQRIEAVGGFKQGSFPFIYLGVPIFKGRKKTDMFLFLREKISAKIHYWSHKFLSFGGRLTLIKSTLGAIPLHIFQVLEPTKEALKQMESLIARYFWESTHEKKATHWISWEQICLQVDEGGLGVRKFEEMVEAFGIKLWVRFREQNSLWANFMFQKYCRKAAPSKVPYSKRQSITWKRMARAGVKIHEHIHWALGEGNIHFWEDIWWKDKPISDLCNPGAILPQKRVKEFWRNGRWNVELVQSVLEPLGVPTEAIADMVRIPIDSENKDTLRWAKSPNGDFTTTSAWELIRYRQPVMQLFKLIWNEFTLPSISIFIWRLLANRIPVDAKLQWRKISLASKCRCCRFPAIETREHLFLHGEAASQVWNSIADWFPSLPRWNAANNDLEKRIKFWHRWLCRSPKPHVSSVIPCLVLWTLWSERNGRIHRGTLFTADSVLNQVVQHIQRLTTAGKLGKEQWRGCVIPERINTSVWRVRNHKQIRLIRWVPPDVSWVKLNTDGKWNIAGSGAGGILRDEEGNLIRGFKSNIYAESHLDAELQALSLGLELVGGRGQKVWIETGNSEIVAIFSTKRQGAAYLRHKISEIRNKLRQISFKVSHIQKEGNKVAYSLAQQGGKETRHTYFDQHTVPSLIKAMMRMDQLGLPYISSHGHIGS